MNEVKYVILGNDNLSFAKKVQVLTIPQLDTHQRYTLKIGELVFIPASVEEETVEDIVNYRIRWELLNTECKKRVIDPKFNTLLIQAGYSPFKV